MTGGGGKAWHWGPVPWGLCWASWGGGGVGFSRQQAPGLAHEGAGPRAGAGHRREGWGGKAPRMPGSSPHAFALGCWVGQTSHGLGELQVLMPHSLGALKDGWELLPLGVSVSPTPPAVLAVGLWLVPVPRDPTTVPMQGAGGHPREELRALGHPCFPPSSSLGWHI